MYVVCCLLYEHHGCVTFVVSMWLLNFDMLMNLVDDLEAEHECWLLLETLGFFRNSEFESIGQITVSLAEDQ